MKAKPIKTRLNSFLVLITLITAFSFNLASAEQINFDVNSEIDYSGNFNLCSLNSDFALASGTAISPVTPERIFLIDGVPVDLPDSIQNYVSYYLIFSYESCPASGTPTDNYSENFYYTNVPDGSSFVIDTATLYNMSFDNPTSITDTPVIFSGSYNTGILYWDNIYLYIVPDNVNQDPIGKLITVLPQTTGTFYIELDLPTGGYSFQARFYNSDTYTFGDWQPSDTTAYTFTVQDLANDATVCNPFSGNITDYFLNKNFSLKGCFLYLFIPTEDSFNQFLTLKDTIEKKAPFGYVKEIFNVLSGFDQNTTKEFELEQVAPITDNIFTPIKTALSWLLWFTFAFLLFKRFKDIQI